MDLEHQQLDLRYERLRVESPDRQRRLVASIAERGQLVPIVVVLAEDPPGRFIVIDGYKRVRALRRLRQDVVQAVRWDLPEIEALLLGRSLRAATGETALEEAWFLDELRRRFVLDLDDLARRFDRSVSWVSRRLALIRELPESVQEQVRRGEIVPHAAMKYLVPLARANRSHCERLAGSIARLEMSSREVGELYGCWRDASGTIRERILEDPALFRRTRRALSTEVVPDDAGGEAELLVRDVHLLSAVARRVRRRWRQGAPQQLARHEREALLGGVRLAAAEIQKVVDSLPSMENIDARPRSPDRDPRTLEEAGADPPDRSHAPGLPGQGPRDCPIAVSPATENRSG
jgi:ParB/RepB/Spo0J family partition protein